MRRLNPYFNLLLCAVILAALSCSKNSPAPVYKIDGKAYGIVKGTFNYRWWNFYERGVSYAEGRFYREAIHDFTEAIARRYEDQRMARTYGMHVVDYFPHREAGILYYETGDYESAKREIELSLEQYPSAKARFYLDRVRKAIIEQAAPDRLSPKLSLDFARNEIWTKEDPVVISGAAEDAHYVSSIAIGDKPVFLEGAEQKVYFKESLKLPRGKHSLKIQAKNLLEGTSTAELTIHVDRDGPALTVDKIDFDKKNKNRITIRGSVCDDSFIKAILMNGLEIPVAKNSRCVQFEQTIAVYEDTLTVTAHDMLGNATLVRTSLSDLTSENSSVLLASIGSDMGEAVCIAKSTLQQYSFPEIQLRGWSDYQTVYLDKIYLEGQVSDDDGVDGITINDAPVSFRKGKKIFFNYFIELNKGENTITVAAVDDKGNTSSKSITILRNIPGAMLLSERLSMTVLPFEHTLREFNESLFFNTNLTSALIRQDRFSIVERGKLDQILNEQKLSETDLVDKNTALRVGRLIAAKSILTGNMLKTRNGFEVVGRLIDTESSEIISAQDVFAEYEGPETFKHLSEGLAIKFHRNFPLVTGNIINCKGKYIFIDIGRERLLHNRNFIIFKEEMVQDDASGRMAGTDYVVVGRAKLTQHLQDISKAELYGCSPKIVNNQQKVVTE